MGCTESKITSSFATHKKHYCNYFATLKKHFSINYAICKKHFRIFAAENNQVKKI